MGESNPGLIDSASPQRECANSITNIAEKLRQNFKGSFPHNTPLTWISRENLSFLGSVCECLAIYYIKKIQNTRRCRVLDSRRTHCFQATLQRLMFTRIIDTDQLRSLWMA